MSGLLRTSLPARLQRATNLRGLQTGTNKRPESRLGGNHRTP